MTPIRLVAALAALATAMLLQATLVGPVFLPLPVSLPVVLVACVALLTGPSTGIALGFGSGLLVDLASNHPVGVLALSWLGLGLVAGVLGGMVTPSRTLIPAPARRPESRRDQALLVGVLGVGVSVVTASLLALLDDGAEPWTTQLLRSLPGGALDAILALAVLPLAAAALASPTLRPAPAARREALR